MAGVDPRHFLAGGMCREEATSAFLATLLHQSVDFQERFFRLCGIPSFTVTDVIVEQEQRDVTVVGANTFVIIENKIASGSKKDGQLVGYYLRVKSQDEGSRVHSVYLSPTRELGKSEVERVHTESGEIAVSVAWEKLQPLCDKLSDFDNLFAETGVLHVLDAIRRRRIRSTRQLEGDELVLRNMMRSIASKLTADHPIRKLDPYGCQLWAFGPITVVIKCETAQREDDGSPEIDTSVQLLFNLEGPNSEDKVYAKNWITPIKKKGKWESFEIDEQNRWMVSRFSRSGEEAQLEELLMADFNKLVTTIYDGIAREKANAVGR